MTLILPLDETYAGNLRDESRTVGFADTVSFPHSEDEVRQVLTALEPGVPVTVQGARTGLAAGAVPQGGHVMDLSRMNRVLALGADGEKRWVRVQPGVVLQDLRSALAGGRLVTEGWSQDSLDALEDLRASAPWFFPTDPTEASATLGGLVACNASGARSYRYGPVRPHVRALRVVLASGDTLELRRGQVQAQDGWIRLVTEQGHEHRVPVPSYALPQAKNASGYYCAPDMDAVDLFVGSDGTLGVVTEVELELLPSPPVVWGVNLFCASEAQALDFVVAARPAVPEAVAFEYFDDDALTVLRHRRLQGGAFAALPEVPEAWKACVYVELAAATTDEVAEALERLAQTARSVGAHPAWSWVGRTEVDRERQRFFRHAVPESVNLLIDERRQTDPGITKLGSDMAVPRDRLHEVMALYRDTLAQEGLESAVWGHIGDNHLHVNVLPRDAAEHARGKALFERWAAAVTAMGGAVSAEHGVGKLKRSFLQTMYGPKAIAQMARVKAALDPAGVLGRGNLFTLDPEAWEAAGGCAAAGEKHGGRAGGCADPQAAGVCGGSAALEASMNAKGGER